MRLSAARWNIATGARNTNLEIVRVRAYYSLCTLNCAASLYSGGWFNRPGTIKGAEGVVTEKTPDRNLPYPMLLSR